MVVATGAPAQDLPVDVFLPRVGTAHRHAVLTALGVVGQGAIHLAILGADHDPFRTVHARGLDHAGGQAGVDQHLGLVGEAAAGVDAVLAVGQLDPLALALGPVRVAVTGVETRHIQRAVVQQVTVGLGVTVVDAIAADELVDELAAFVVAHVDHCAAIAGLRQGGVLMLEAAQGGALDRGRLRIERVDLHHPAVAVEFVGVLGQVEARVVLVPVDVAAGHRGAVALLGGVELVLGVAAAEAVGEVLFAGQVGAPRGLAVGAVLEGAEDFLALGVGAGLEQRVAGGRAAEADRRVAVDAPVVARALDELPLAVLALHLDHRHAFAGLGLAHVLGRLRQAAVGIEVAIVGVLVVDRHQRPMPVIREGEQAHAVVVVAKLRFLGQGGAVAAGVEGRAVLVQRLAPADQHRGRVARWQGDGVASGAGDAGKAQQLAVAGADSCGQGAAAQQVAAQEQGRAAQGAGTDEAAAAEADDLFQVGGLVFF